jgi:two-component system cell cycle response regulator DivK
MTTHALIVEDNRANIEVLQMLLEQQGVAHTAVVSARHVPDVLDAGAPINIVFLDLSFPNDDGFQIFAQLRADPRLTNVPIVAYTVHQSEIERARRMGFNAFIGKPLNANHFPQQLQRILDGEPVWEL